MPSQLERLSGVFVQVASVSLARLQAAIPAAAQDTAGDYILLIAS